MKRFFRITRTPQSGPRDVHSEIDTHLALRAREFEAQGMPPDDARRAAADAFGDRRSIEAEVARVRAHTLSERRRRDWFADLFDDARIGLRGLRRAPAFTIVALLTLVLGIGANTAIFSALRSVLLRPLPYPQPEQLVQLWTDHRALGRTSPEWFSPPEFLDWQASNRTFSAMAAYQGWGPDLTGVGDPVALAGYLVTGDYFRVLGARPQLGRLLTAEDDDPGAARSVVLTDAAWRRVFGADPAIIDRAIELSGVSWTVVGVLTPDFRPPLPASADVFRAMRRPSDSGCGRGCIVWRAIGRLAPGVSFDDARADLDAIAARQAADYPRTNDKVGAWPIPLHEQVTSSARPALLALAAAAGLVLLIGCVNLANLLLVRGASRAREMSVRAALGAGGGRIVRQVVTENGLLALIGGVLGAAVGARAGALLSPLVPANILQVQEIRTDWAVLAFAVGATVVSALLFGLLPAISAARGVGFETLRGGTRAIGVRGRALRGGLVVAQLTLAVMLLTGGGLLLRSFMLMQRVDLGYRQGGVALTSVFLPPARYPGPAAGERMRTLLAQLRANPAFRAVALTDIPPLSAGDQDIGAIPVGEPPRDDLPPSIWYRSVSPNYFATIGMRVVEGRGLAEDDGAGGPLAGVVNEEAAARYWPGKSAVGRVLSGGSAPDAPQVTIVGVVASARTDGPDQPYKPELYLSMNQVPVRAATMVLEPATDITAAATAFRATLHDFDALIPAGSVTPFEDRLGDAVALPKLYALLVGAFACVALGLALLGVYGVMAYAVSQRRREIGVRLALGAAPASIRAMVLGEGSRLATIGLVAGIGGVLVGGRLIESLLFGVAVLDLPTLGVVTALLGGMTIAAAWVPARRAMRVDPLLTMRDD